LSGSLGFKPPALPEGMTEQVRKMITGWISKAEEMREKNNGGLKNEEG